MCISICTKQRATSLFLLVKKKLIKLKLDDETLSGRLIPRPQNPPIHFRKTDSIYSRNEEENKNFLSMKCIVETYLMVFLSGQLGEGATAVGSQFVYRGVYIQIFPVSAT